MDDHLLYRILEHVFPNATVKILPPFFGSQNRHGIVYMQSSQTLFVKFYTSEKSFYCEGLAINALACSCSWIILSECAGKEQGICWRAFSYKRLRPAILDPALACEWGRLLGEVHATLAPQNLERMPGAIDRVDPYLRALLAFPDIMKRAEHIWGLAYTYITSSAVLREYDLVFLTNDFGLRNTFIQVDTANMILLDFERSAVGDAHWDLGLCWDRELRDQNLRNHFLEGYLEKRQPLSDPWPHPATLWMVRFVEALDIFPYAHRVHDQPFFEYGLDKLTILETEAKQWT